MSTISWRPRQQDTTSYSKSTSTLVLLGVALGSGICFMLFTALVQYLCSRNCYDVDADEEGGGMERRNAGGVTAPVLASLPTFAYWKSKTDGGDCGRWPGEYCAVCLEVVQEGELVRRLPACHHTFHVECIDMWLCSHSTCPLCRATVEPVEVLKGIDRGLQIGGGPIISGVVS